MTGDGEDWVDVETEEVGSDQRMEEQRKTARKAGRPSQSKWKRYDHVWASCA